MSNLWYTLAGAKLAPELGGLGRDETPNADLLGMAPGNRRIYVRPSPRQTRWVLSLSGASEAEWAVWRAAAQTAQTTASTFVEPDGSSHTVWCVRFSDPISASTPTANEGTLTATGTVERDLTLELESL